MIPSWVKVTPSGTIRVSFREFIKSEKGKQTLQDTEELEKRIKENRRG